MSYVGQNLPTDVFGGYTTDTFAGDGSATTFTLSQEPISEQGLIVVINNVIQQPTTNYTVSGTTLTIVGTAVASGDVIYARHTGVALPIGEASAVTEGTTIDLNGGSDKLILDADADTTISADTDDQIDIKIGGADDFQFTANTFTAQSGSTIAAQALTATTGTFASNVTISTADNTDTLSLISTDADASVGPVLLFNRDSASPAANDFLGTIDFQGDNSAGDTHDYIRILSRILSTTDGSEQADLIFKDATGNNIVNFAHSAVVFNDDSVDRDFRVESNSYASTLVVDANENAVFVGTTAFYDTDAIFTVRSGSSSNVTQHMSNTSGSYTGNMLYFSQERDESDAFNFIQMTDYNDAQIKFAGDGDGFFDGAADAGNADFAEYFESTDGSAIAIGKTVVLDNGKIRASTDSDNAADIVGVVRDRKTVGVVGNSAWSKWKDKYKVDDYGVPLLEEYTITEWDQIVAEDADDLEITYKGEKKKLPQVKGDTIHHSYATDRIPSELTAPSDAVVKTKDADGNIFKRKILNDNYDASKTYVSRKDRDEWNLIGLIGQVTMTKGQKTGDRWIKMRDISSDVEEWLVR